MLKISGEALAGPAGFGIDPDTVALFAAEVAATAKCGVQVLACRPLLPRPAPLASFGPTGRRRRCVAQVAVVVGGGNFFRGKEREGRGLDRASADYMGMLATVMNAIQLQAALEAAGVPTRVQTAIDMKARAPSWLQGQTAQLEHVGGRPGLKPSACAGGGRALYSAAGHSPPGEGPHRHFWGRNGQPVFHHRHGSGPASCRDRGRGVAESHQGAQCPELLGGQTASAHPTCPDWSIERSPFSSNL